MPSPLVSPNRPTLTPRFGSLQAIASQHIPGSLTQRAQFAFNKQLNRNKKVAQHSTPQEQESWKGERGRAGLREVSRGGFEPEKKPNNAVWEKRCDIDLFNNYNKRKFYNYCACKQELLLS